jgi:adenylate cyclase
VPSSVRRLAAIMFTDMVGYSALAQADEEAALTALQRHNGLLRPIFARFRGREVKTVGDAFLVEFESALDAARCALEIQRALHDYNATSSERWKLQVRVGIHVGDVEETDGDVLGDAVNIASRIEPLAEPGGICLTQQVYDQVENKLAASLSRLPPVRLKNIRLPTNVYAVVPSWDGSADGRKTAPPPTGRQLAVLPLANISPDPADAYFADGLTEELISVLSQVRGLSVIARTSVSPYKTSPKPIPEVGAELGVDTVLEGSVRKSGNRLRITLQLIDVATQRHVWASSYNREVDDVFAVQVDIAERTAAALKLELADQDGPGSRRRPTANPAAYDAYLRGLVASMDIRRTPLQEVVECFSRATELDPTFAEAFAAWANAYVIASGDYVSMREVMPRARELAARALELDPESADAHATLANIALQADNDWAVAESEFLRALELNPSNVTAYRFYALLLMAQERFDEAKEAIRHVVRLDPAAGWGTMLGWAEMDSGHPEVAIADAERARDRDPTSWANRFALGLAYLEVGRTADAAREADAEVSRLTDAERFDRALLQVLVGRPEAGREMLARVDRGELKTYISATDRAMMHSALGEREKALDLLEQDARAGERVFWLYYRGIFFDPIREDPRFSSLLRQLKLPERPPRRLARRPA